MELLITKWEKKGGDNTLTAKGLIRVNDNKPEFGSLMLMSELDVDVDSGFFNTRNKIGFLTGRISDIKKVIKKYNLKEGMDYCKVFGPHRIATIEILESQFKKVKEYEDSVEPNEEGFRKKQTPDGTLLTKKGEQIWWKTQVVSEGNEMQDSRVKHDNIGRRASNNDLQGSAGEEFDKSKKKKKKKKNKVF